MTTGNTGQGMSSLEIAELTGKQHKNVMRDIKALIDKDAIDITEGDFALRQYKDSSGKVKTMYFLYFKAIMILIRGYDAKQNFVVIDRWVALKKGTAQPAHQQIDQPQTVTRRHKEQLEALQITSKVYREGLRVAKTYGLTANQAVFSANSAAKKVVGVDLMKYLGVTHLIAVDQERFAHSHRDRTFI